MTIFPVKHWLIIPAAGIGKRMGTAIPKQYMKLNGKTVIQVCIEKLIAAIDFVEIIVVLAENDTYWKNIAFKQDKVQTVTGGKERADSVMAGLSCISAQASEQDWIWVHDAARPCIRLQDLVLLRDTIAAHDIGGILGLPVRDTMKQVVDNTIKSTLDRSQIWHALTPQVFRYGKLLSAMKQAIADGANVTDESSALEYAGYTPLIVEGHSENIKITHPSDLQLAEFYLNHQ